MPVRAEEVVELARKHQALVGVAQQRRAARAAGQQLGLCVPRPPRGSARRQRRRRPPRPNLGERRRRRVLQRRRADAATLRVPGCRMQGL